MTEAKCRERADQCEMAAAATLKTNDEIIGLLSRRARLQRCLRFIDEPVATALIRSVVADMEKRIASIIESDGQKQAGEGVTTALQPRSPG